MHLRASALSIPRSHSFSSLYLGMLHHPSLAKVDNGRCNGFGGELQVYRIFGQKRVKNWHLSNDRAPAEIVNYRCHDAPTSSPCSMKPRRLGRVSSPITSKVK